MRKRILPCLLIIPLLFGPFLFSQDHEELFNGRRELYFKFDHPGDKLLAELSRLVSIDDVGKEVYAYANPVSFKLFSDLGLEYEVLTPPSMLHPVSMKTFQQLKQANDWDSYPTYEAYIEMMYQFEEDYPDICTVVSIGESIEGRELLFIRISDNIETEEGEPQFLYTSSIHGDETTGIILTLRLIDYLLSNYGSDDEVNELVDQLDIWINPMANPDGTYADGNTSVYGATRYNANGVDLNRNYPDPEDGPNPDGNEWQQETILFMQFAEENQFVMGANFHGGAEVCNYPWDTWSDLHPDDDWWQYVCHEYADTAQEMSPSGYMSGYDDGITNGYAWYTISGGRQDYMNYFHQTREFTLEISDTKLLPAYQLPDLWDYNYRSLLNYMKQALYGLSGAVTDAATGDPVYASVFIEDHDEDSSWVYTYPLNGKYYRPLYEGTYDVTYSAEGYYSQTIEDVVIENGALTLVDVQLESGDLIADFTASDTQIPIGSTVDFTDLTFGSPQTWEWTFEGGEPSFSSDQNPLNILYAQEGLYDVSLTVSDGTFQQTILKENFIAATLDFEMEDATVTTCSGIFYDGGGADNDYGDDENFIMTFLPDEENGKIEMEFTEFAVEYHDDCNYDWLKIFDGPDINANLIGTYCGLDSPGTVTASNEEGALTFQFYSDYSATESGWVAVISCVGDLLPPEADFVADNIVIIEGGYVSFADLSANDPESWDWVFEGGTPASSGEQNPEVLYTDPGVFDVTLTVSNSAGSNTITKENYITVDPLSGYSSSLHEGLQVYPNPATDRITIKAATIIRSIQVHAIAGEEMLYSRPEANSHELSLEKLSKGIYMLTIYTDDRIIRKKLEVAR